MVKPQHLVPSDEPERRIFAEADKCARRTPHLDYLSDDDPESLIPPEILSDLKKADGLT